MIQIRDHLEDGWILGLKAQRSHGRFELAPERQAERISRVNPSKEVLQALSKDTKKPTWNQHKHT